jgi:hypothetical protein
MAVDFSELVLAPAIATFGKRVTIIPKASQPYAAPYCANGIWTVTQVDLMTEDGGTLSNRTLKFGIRLADFTFVPKKGDWITTPVCELPLGYWEGEFEPNSNIDLVIDDFQPDGQGGATLVLKRVVQ